MEGVAHRQGLSIVDAIQDVAEIFKTRGYIPDRVIGQGAFGKAVLVQNSSGTRLICKMISFSKTPEADMEEAVKESQLLASIQHAYIVRHHESFIECGWFCIIMDFCDCGDLSKPIAEARRRNRPLEHCLISRWFTQIILALYYIHDRHILHRDLKPANLFLSREANIQMGDFGLAKQLACTAAVAKTRIGTPHYVSPEVCQDHSYNWPADVWSMGCILYELCALKVPFDSPSISGVLDEIMRGRIPLIPCTYPRFLQDLGREMMQRQPSLRPTCNDILQCPDVQNVAMQMLSTAEEQNVDVSFEASVGAKSSSTFARFLVDDDSLFDAGNATRPFHQQPRFEAGDLVDFYIGNVALPTRVAAVDSIGSVSIDLRAASWISLEEQSATVRLRSGSIKLCQTPRTWRTASPIISRTHLRADASFELPSDGHPATPSAARRPGRSYSLDVFPSKREVSAFAVPRSLSFGNACGLQRKHEPPTSDGNLDGEREADGRSVSNQAGGIARGNDENNLRTHSRVYRTGDVVEYYSRSKLAWLPATIVFSDFGGRVIVNVNPGTWLCPEEQFERLRAPCGSAVALSTSRNMLCESSQSSIPADIPRQAITPNFPRSQSLKDVGISRLMSPPTPPSSNRKCSARSAAMTDSPDRHRSLSSCSPEYLQRSGYLSDESPLQTESVVLPQASRHRKPPALPRADSLRRGGAIIAGL